MSEATYILGINCFKHDAAAVLLRDGQVIAAAEEERFIREKHTGRFPERAIKFCLEYGRIDPDQLDHVAYYMVPKLALLSLLKQFGPKALLPGARGRTTRRFIKNQLPGVINFFRIPALFQKTFPHFDLSRLTFHWIPHHIAHAASTYFASGFEKSVILTLDGVGEHATGGVFTATGERIVPQQQWVVPHSLGLYYRAVTAYLGFAIVFDEFKVMGLAAYGNPVYGDEFLAMAGAGHQSGFFIDPDYFDFIAEYSGSMIRSSFVDKFGPVRHKSEPLTQHHKDIAASLQFSLEQTVLTITAKEKERWKIPNLCFAGGVAMNSSLNGRLLRDSGFDNFYVQPVSYDAGTSLGAAVYVDRVVLHNHRTGPLLKDLFLGPEFTENDIEHLLHEAKLPYEKPDNIALTVAEMLANGAIVGWFQGRMEFGARALGHRSILADPRKAENKDKVNHEVKHREHFRPFAPAVKEEEASKFFDMEGPSPYMAMVLPVKENARDKIPAVTHYDNTARVQTVSRKSDPLFWQLLDAFENKTSIPVILNTSFNIMGEPIVCTPQEAISCFYTTGLDVLAIGPFIIKK